MPITSYAIISEAFKFAEIEFPMFAISVIANLVLGLIVLLYAREDTPKRHFMAFVVAQGLWITANYIGFLVPDKYFLLATRLALFFATFHALFFLLLVRAFLRRSDSFEKDTLIFGILAGVVGIFTLTPFVFTTVNVGNSGLEPNVGAGIIIFGAFIATCILLSLVYFIKGYRKSEGTEKAQWRSLAVGLSITFALVLLFVFINFIFLDNASTVRFGHLYTLPFVVFTAYAIVRHELLNVKVITAQAMVILLCSIIFIQILSAETYRQIFISGIVFIGTISVGAVLVRGVIQEVHQRNKLQELTDQLAKSNTKLQELDKLKSEFLSFASHQVKAPMSIIKGFATLIADGTYGPVSDKIRETAQKIRDSSDRLIALVSNLLDLRKIQEGHMDFTFEVVEVRKLLTSIVDEMHALAEKKELTLVFETDLSDLALNIDEQKFRQVIQNLIDNSIKYTDHGWIKVRLEADHGAHTATISISDSGRGMSKELIPKLFEQFTRDKDTAKEIAGTGLGLYIAKQIILGHHGEIWVTSDGEDTGSTFFVRMPLA